MTVRTFLTPLVLLLLVVAGCATESADEGAIPPASDTPGGAETPPADEPVATPSPQPTTAPSPGPDASGGQEAPPVQGACLEGATECADMPGEGSGAPPGAQPTLLEPRDDLVDVHATPWVEVVPDDDQDELTVSWWGGNTDCYGLDRVEVEETAEVVTITVHTGRVSGVDICTLEAVYVGTTVTLREPLGPRSIADGACPPVGTGEPGCGPDRGGNGPG